MTEREEAEAIARAIANYHPNGRTPIYGPPADLPTAPGLAQQLADCAKQCEGAPGWLRMWVEATPLGIKLTAVDGGWQFEDFEFVAWDAIQDSGTADLLALSYETLVKRMEAKRSGV
jgi:hypothetical protein